MTYLLKNGGLAGSTQPSERQKVAGNYEKGHAVLHGMRISVENAAGTDRHGKDEGGNPWKQRLAHSYGYIRGTTGKDKDHVDVFLGPEADNPDHPVHVIDQDKKGGGSVFDEHKVMMGFPDEDSAIMAYHRNYEPGWDGFRAVTAMPISQFREWAYAGKSGKRKPASEYAAFKGAEDHEQDIEHRRDDIRAEGRARDNPQETGGEADGQLSSGGLHPDRAVDVGKGAEADPGRAARPTAPGRRGLQEDGTLPEAESDRLRDGRASAASSGSRPRAADPRFPGLRAGGLVSPQRGSGEDSTGAVRGYQSGTTKGAKGLSDGGVVGADTEGGAYTGARGRRREANNDREASKDLPASAARGVLAGTLGLPGDLEGLLRSLSKLPSLSPAQALLSAATRGSDTTPSLPTSEFFNEALPGRVEGPSQRAAEGLGNLLGVSPVGAVGKVAKGVTGLGEAAAKAGPALRGALGQVAENAMAPRTLSSQAGAVKLPGGNWFGPHLEQGISRVTRNSNEPVKDWMTKRLTKYVQNQMGTAGDPLIKLGQEGKLHLSADDLARRADDLGAAHITGNFPGAPGYQLEDHTDALHQQLTGRQLRSPWETLSDSAVDQGSARRSLREATGRGDAPSWLQQLGNQDPSASIHDVHPSVFDNLGFDHVSDYLNSATGANVYRKNYPTEPRLQRALDNALGDTAQAHRDLMARNLDIDPDKLGQMALPDVIRKTSEWNKYMSEQQKLLDMNKGIKQVHKQYPDTGHQWVELDETGLGNEGKAMGHCVGGHCDSVSSGRKRIMSLRDKEGQPHVTVEIEPGTKAPEGSVAWDKLPEELRASLDSRGLAPGPDETGTLFDQQGKRYVNTPDKIHQIKGKANAAPVAQYLPAVQDFVKNMGPWDDKIGDFQNTGLTRVNRPYSARGSKGEISVPNGMYTNDELLKFFTDAGEEPDTASLFVKGFPQSGYASGGTVIGTPTVGLGTFAAGQDQPQQAQNQGQTQGQPQGWGFGSSGQAQQQPDATGGSGLWSDRFGMELNGLPGLVPGAGGAPSKNLAPSYTLAGYDSPLDSAYDRPGDAYKRGVNSNTFSGTPDPMLQATLRSADAGSIQRGASAFLGMGFNPFAQEFSGSDMGYVDTPNKQAQLDTLRQTAGALGVDTSRYTDGTGGGNDSRALYDDLNQRTKDYYMVSGLSNGWDGSSNPRSASRTLYRNDNGRLMPASTPQHYMERENPGWIRGDGAETITALSMMLPAVGGWAGLVGQAGTAAAPYVNAAGSALYGGATGGTNGALASLAGTGGGALGQVAGSALGGYGQVGQQLGSQAGRTLYTRSRT